MRQLLVAAALVAASSAFAGDLVAKQGSDSVRLTQAACPVEVLKVLPEGLRGFFRRAVVYFEGKSWIACWAPRNDGQVHIHYADGDAGLIPLEMFSEEPDA